MGAKCKKEIKLYVSIQLYLPARYTNLISKSVIRKKECQIVATDWCNARHICYNCGYQDINLKEFKRLKFSIFLLLNKEPERAIDVATNRISDQSVNSEIYQLKNALFKGGIMDEKWWILNLRKTKK